jgi:hypothetical protein
VRGVPEESFNPKQLIAFISKLTAIFDPARSAIAAVRLVLKEKEPRSRVFGRKSVDSSPTLRRSPSLWLASTAVVRRETERA